SDLKLSVPRLCGLRRGFALWPGPTRIGVGAFRMNARNQRLCVWSAAAMIGIMLAGLLVAGFLPLPAPSMTASEVAALISEHTLRIQVGMVLVACGAAFLGPFISAVTVQMRRIEREHSPLSWLQLGLGMLFVFEFILPCFVCLAATYRPQRSPEVT